MTREDRFPDVKGNMLEPGDSAPGSPSPAPGQRLGAWTDGDPPPPPLPDAVRSKLQSLPASPGVYQMKDVAGRIIYVGKATSLRARVRSYFQGSRDMHPRTRVMVSRICDLEVISTDTELEALMLESNLIKRHRPPFNVKMRDDKRYPMLEVTLGERWPRIRLVRRPTGRKSRFFGPYTNSLALRRTMKLLARAFRVRTCSLPLERPLERPCLDYHVQQCTAPCTRFITEQSYRESVLEACQFLEGHTGRLVESLRRDMEVAAEALDFERCIRLRNVIQAVEQVTERQKMILEEAADLDVLGLAQRDGAACVAVLCVREGKLVDEQHFVLDAWLVHAEKEVWDAAGEFAPEGTSSRGQAGSIAGGGEEAADVPAGAQGESAPEGGLGTFAREGEARSASILGTRREEAAGAEEVASCESVAVTGTGRDTLRSFLVQYYGVGRFIPPLILVPTPVADADLLERMLTGLRSRMSKEDARLSERAETAMLGEPSTPTRRCGERRVRVRLRVPQRGARRELVLLAERNAAHHLHEFRQADHTRVAAVTAALDELQRALDLPHPPWRIECYDISNIQG